MPKQLFGLTMRLGAAAIASARSIMTKNLTACRTLQHRYINTFSIHKNLVAHIPTVACLQPDTSILSA
jgi:hypothetical protein